MEGGDYRPRKDERGKIFVGGLSWETTKESLQEYFGQFGELLDVSIMENPQTGKSRGFGFITFADYNIADYVLTVKPHMVDGRPVDAKVCNARAAAVNKQTGLPETRPRPGGIGGGGGGMQDNLQRLGSMMQNQQQRQNNNNNYNKFQNKVFIGGIPPNADDDVLKSVFAQFGNVIDVNVMVDPSKGRSRGFGFLTFDNEDSVEAACLQHYVNVNGKKVECKRAQPQSKNQQPQEDPLAAIEGQLIKQITNQLQAPPRQPGETPLQVDPEHWAQQASQWNQTQAGQTTQYPQYYGQQGAAAPSAYDADQYGGQPAASGPPAAPYGQQQSTQPQQQWGQQYGGYGAEGYQGYGQQSDSSQQGADQWGGQQGGSQWGQSQSGGQGGSQWGQSQGAGGGGYGGTQSDNGYGGGYGGAGRHNNNGYSEERRSDRRTDSYERRGGPPQRRDQGGREHDGRGRGRGGPGGGSGFHPYR